MPGPEEITKRLESAGINYCIVGGLAAIAYGRPRLTLDADLVLALQVHQVGKLLFFREGGSEKHIDDIRAVLAGGHRVDQELLQKWVEKLGLQKEWRAVSLSDA